MIKPPFRENMCFFPGLFLCKSKILAAGAYQTCPFFMRNKPLKCTKKQHMTWSIDMIFDPGKFCVFFFTFYHGVYKSPWVFRTMQAAWNWSMMPEVPHKGSVGRNTIKITKREQQNIWKTRKKGGLGWVKLRGFCCFLPVFFQGWFFWVGEVKVKSRKELQNHLKAIPIVMA